MNPIVAGLIGIAVVLFGAYLAAFRPDPFHHPFQLKAVFRTVNNMRTGTPVRVAGLSVGKVTKVTALDTQNGPPAAEVTMEIEDAGLPIHGDARAKIRTRLFLEGTNFVELNPGSTSAGKLHSGDVLPPTQTAAPVQLSQVLTSLQSDTRHDLQSLLQEYSKGLAGGGAEGYNRSLRWWEPAYRNTAIANQASLGTQPHDLRRVLRGQRDVFGALSENTQALEDLVTNFHHTGRALARNSDSLRATVPALRDVLRVGTPTLQALDSALPSLRSFARDALPGVRSSVPALDASRPFVTQARALVSQAELKGLAADLRPTIPTLASLNAETVPLLEETRQLSSCQNHVLLPWSTAGVPDPDFPANSDQPFYKQAPRTLVGLAGESREHDANGPLFRGLATAGPTTIAQPAEGGGQLFGTTAFPPQGTRPAKPDHRPRMRPDVACETQDPPNLNAPRGDATATVAPDPLPLPDLSAADQKREQRVTDAVKQLQEKVGK
jgi:virulence factor Mce-like protein